MRYLGNLFISCLLAFLISCLAFGTKVSAAPAFIQASTGVTNGGTSVSATYTTAATANRLLIAVCATNEATAISGPSGFSSAINESAAEPAQGVFYKIAAGGETSLSCALPSGTINARMGIHIFEYSGINTATPFHIANSATGSATTTLNSGSVTTTNANALLFAAGVTGSNTSISTWTNSFIERTNFGNSTGSGILRRTYSAASRGVTTTGTYSTTATLGASSNYRGQIVAFNATASVLSVDIVDASGVSVASPSVNMPSRSFDFNCSASSGTLGINSQRIRVDNTTSTAAWTVAIAATGGATDRWTTGTIDYDFNDGSGTPAGCADGGDADTLAGRLTVNPAGGTSTPQSGCTNTGITLGSNASFSEGVTNSITLISASSSADINCYWDLTNVGLSQQIPAEQSAGSYTINLTLTVAAS